jgi:hypothetical protein
MFTPQPSPWDGKVLAPGVGGRDDSPLGRGGRAREALSQRGFDANDLSTSRPSKVIAPFSIQSSRRPC